MARSITLAADVQADAGRVFEMLSTTEGQRGFWTADCEVSAGHARFGFPQAPVVLETDVTTEAGKMELDLGHTASDLGGRWMGPGPAGPIRHLGAVPPPASPKSFFPPLRPRR